MDAELRKERLRDARRALFSRDPAALSAALAGLPPTGAKAAALRERLSLRLRALQEGRTATQLSLGFAEEAGTVEVGDAARGPQELRVVDSGNEHVFLVAELDSLAPFGLRVSGAQVSIILNSDHPAFETLALPIAASAGPRQPVNHLVRPGVRELLIAWSRLELGVDQDILRDRLRRTREDLGFALADVVAASGAPK